MKRFALFVLLCGLLGAPSLLAQNSNEDHFTLGAYADYLRLAQTDTNFAGLGGRVGVGLGHHVLLEAEMSYDFDQVFSERFSNGGSFIVNKSNAQLLHGLFGPALALGHSNFHPFVTLKGGFLDTRLSAAPANFSTFTSDVANLRASNVMGAVYPGGGVEGHLGPLGLRFEVGDEVYFNNGGHNNLRVSIGPYIRF